MSAIASGEAGLRTRESRPHEAVRAASDFDALPPNGRGAAAVLAAAIGCLALAILAFAGDAVPWFARAMELWPPTGPLSGVTSLAILVWAASWIVLARSWRGRDLRLRWVIWAAAAMLGGALLLTFPPFMDALQGK